MRSYFSQMDGPYKFSINDSFSCFLFKRLQANLGQNAVDSVDWLLDATYFEVAQSNWKLVQEVFYNAD